MTDHPAIVALAKAQYERRPYYDEYDRPMPWDKLSQDYRDEQIADAALDYAVVLKNLKRMAIKGEKHDSGLIVYPPPGTKRWLDDRAREIGVD